MIIPIGLSGSQKLRHNLGVIDLFAIISSDFFLLSYWRCSRLDILELSKAISSLVQSKVTAHPIGPRRNDRTGIAKDRKVKYLEVRLFFTS